MTGMSCLTVTLPYRGPDRRPRPALAPDQRGRDCQGRAGGARTGSRSVTRFMATSRDRAGPSLAGRGAPGK